MQVVASGQAGLFAIQNAHGFTIKRLDNGATHQSSAGELAYYFAGCNDVTAFTAKNEREAEAAAEAAWAADRAVRLFVMLLDPQEEPGDLAEVGEALDELLDLEGTTARVERQIYSAPLPQPIDFHAIAKALETAPKSKDLLERFLGLQSTIARVRNEFDLIDESVFGDARRKREFFEEAIDRGSVRALVIAANTAHVDKALFQLYSDLKGLDNHRVIIQAWTQPFARVHHKFELRAEPEELHRAATPTSPVGGRQAYERALQQQVAIVERIRSADFDTARRFTRDLIIDQRNTGSSEHLAKSLTNLSQKAKDLNVLELALEWATEAVEVKGDDGIAHAQLADLLMQVGRYVEASHSLDLAQTYGEAGFAESGRARMLRYQGHYAEALAAYREAVNHYGEDYEQAHYNFAGIAECLRDMERLDEALAAYDVAISRWPYEAVLHAGRAATLVEMGRFEEALAGYDTAINLDDNNIVYLNGIASLRRRAGDFGTAESSFRAIVADYPFDIYARGGLISTLRDVGRFGEAVDEARTLVDYFPASPDALWILADALIDAKQFDEAKDVLDSAVKDNRHSEGLRAGLARIEKARGRYAAALALYDEAARDFPSNQWFQLGRAGMLRRLGNVDEALRIYERAFQRHPHRLNLKNAMASIFIHQKHFDEALPMLTIDNPRTTHEWRNFVLRGMLDSETGFTDEARERFEWGIKRCPFRRESRMLRAALSNIQLRSGAADQAVETTKDCADDVTELLRFHANAMQGHEGVARDLYLLLKESFLPEPYHELRDEIARYYNVVPFPARHDRSWILERESDVLLLEAA
jgi:tetratricopeptide (TPR) repeat protein